MDPRAPWDVVERFEKALCEYTGAPNAIAVDSCTNALRLCFEKALVDCKDETEPPVVPCRTYVGVIRALIISGLNVEYLNFSRKAWSGEYPIEIGGRTIVDAARWLRRDMYRDGTWTCLSFHFSKHLPIGRGGAILCDDEDDAEWFRRAAYDGRDRTKPIMEQKSFQWGAHVYLPPESAARGLLLMTNLKDDNAPLPGIYPDLSQVSFE